ncbi:MAG: saccharopine dehydrogenase NADP-binding domain-containing protein [Theionarchaea archaeon]|nr:saccharopine dehydrogenase NADP-binding domain-containing protein [Theionarchaea archaeon]
MKALVLGAGMMGKALAYDLKKSNYEVITADMDNQRTEEVQSLTGCEIIVTDIADEKKVFSLMKDCDVAISAVPYFFNYKLAQTAVEAGCHFCDLGGNNDIVNMELSLDEKARNVLIIPDCGLAPGMTNVIAAVGIQETEAEEVHIRVGGLPQNPRPPLDYTLVFSVHGLLNEYKEPAVVVRKGEIKRVESLTEVEEIDFPPIGILEAFQTSGGTSTLPQTYKGVLEELDYKTIRYKGHCAKMKVLFDVGMCSEDFINVGTCAVKPRDVLSRVLEDVLPHEDKDMVLMRITVRGNEKMKTFEMIDYYDEQVELTAMARTTAFPTSIIAQMMADNTITERGALPPERVVPGRKFMEELRKRNIIIKECDSAT